MGNRVTFDYSKAGKFISDAEMTCMEKTVALAKETLAVSYTHLTLPTNSRV